MTNDVPGSNGAPADQQKFLIQRLYLKDLSFESPSSPGVFNEEFTPTVNLVVKSSYQSAGTDLYEAVLHLRIHATSGERSSFVVEIDQAGIFEVSGYTPDQIKTILATHCPETLFPYAREVISSLVMKGGFPPLVLQPINFDAALARGQITNDLA